MGFWSRTFTWWNGATWGTALFTRRFGNEVGRDGEGNIYYQDKKRPNRRLPRPPRGGRGRWRWGFWSRTSPGWNGAGGGPALSTRRFGKEVGREGEGNIYYQEKKRPNRRWVIYNGDNDGSRVPPDWQ